VRYDPKLPDDSVNVSDGSIVREAATLLLGFCLVVGLLGVTLAFTIEHAVAWLPAGVETYVFQSVWDDLEISAESPHEAPLEALLARITEADPELAERFRVGVLESDHPNALALPGGMMLFTTTLLDAVESENELAFVLGHELGHYRNRDHLRGLGQGLSWALVSSAFGLESDAAGLLASFSADLTQRGFSRQQELAADLNGLAFLARHYGHAGGTRRVFEVLLVGPEEADEAEVEAEVESEPDGTISRYLDSHPPHPARIEALERAIAEQGLDATGPLTPWMPADPG
jgi:Zn-dependent protease with chaperone function